MTEIAPCPRCHYGAGPQGAERYWESRWRDEKAHNDALREALGRIEQFNGGQIRSPMQDIAKDAITVALQDIIQHSREKFAVERAVEGMRAVVSTSKVTGE